MVQRAGPLLWRGRRKAPDRRPRARPAGRKPHRAAFYRRLCRRPALPDIASIRLCRRPVPGTARRRIAAGRLPYQQHGALRAAAKQAAAGRDQHLPPVSRSDDRGDAAAAFDHRPWPCGARQSAEGVETAQCRRTVLARRRSPGRSAQALRQLPLLALQHQHRRADAGDVSCRVREGEDGFGLKRL